MGSRLISARGYVDLPALARAFISRESQLAFMRQYGDPCLVRRCNKAVRPASCSTRARSYRQGARRSMIVRCRTATAANERLVQGDNGYPPSAPPL